MERSIWGKVCPHCIRDSQKHYTSIADSVTEIAKGTELDAAEVGDLNELSDRHGEELSRKLKHCTIFNM
jgi:hypothetical protein